MHGVASTDPTTCEECGPSLHFAIKLAVGPLSDRSVAALKDQEG